MLEIKRALQLFSYTGLGKVTAENKVQILHIYDYVAMIIVIEFYLLDFNPSQLYSSTKILLLRFKKKSLQVCSPARLIQNCTVCLTVKQISRHKLHKKTHIYLFMLGHALTLTRYILYQQSNTLKAFEQTFGVQNMFKSWSVCFSAVVLCQLNANYRCGRVHGALDTI